jgi:hypothetical protein
MNHKHATFSHEAFNRADARAREETTSYLDDLGYDVNPHPNPYAQDLVATCRRTGKKFLVECEQKSLWKGERFPFQSVQLPERKKKFFDERTLFFIWNNEWDSAMIFWSTQINHLEPVEVPNRRIAKGEYFFQIPLSLTKQVWL